MTNVSLANDRPFVLVVALDLAGTASGGYALDQALRIATRVAASQLHVLHVSASDVESETLGLLRRHVSERATMFGGMIRQAVAVHVRQGDPAQQIAQLATDLAADLLIVGTDKPPQLRSLFVGSTAERLMAAITCPVVVAGPTPQPQPAHVIAIEPACRDCVQARLRSGGRSWWCDRHSDYHAVLQHHHIYSYGSGFPFESADYEVSATGVD